MYFWQFVPFRCLNKLFHKSRSLYPCCNNLPSSIKTKGSHLQSFQTGRDDIRLSPAHQFQVRAAESAFAIQTTNITDTWTATLTPLPSLEEDILHVDLGPCWVSLTSVFIILSFLITCPSWPHTPLSDCYHMMLWTQTFKVASQRASCLIKWAQQCPSAQTCI